MWHLIDFGQSFYMAAALNEQIRKRKREEIQKECKMPTLTWTGEIMPIKQGAPVMITLFCGFGYIALLFVGFVLLPGWTLGFLGYMSCFVGANLLLSVPIYLWLRKQGVARFSAL